MGDVCAADYANQLKAIGQKVVESVNSLTLSCLPVDLDKDGTPEIRVELADGTPAPAFTVNQFTLNFTQALPEGNHTIRYRCLK